MVNTTEVKKIESDIVGAGKYVVIEIDKLFAIIERHLPGHMPEVKNFKAETTDLIATSTQIHNPEPTGNDTTAATAGEPRAENNSGAQETGVAHTGTTDGDSLGESSTTSPSSATLPASSGSTSPETQTSAASTLSGGASS